MCLSSGCHRSLVKVSVPEKRQVCIYKEKKGLSPSKQTNIPSKTFILCGWMKISFLPSNRSLFRRRIRSCFLGEVNWKISVKTLRWLWRSLKSAPGGCCWLFVGMVTTANRWLVFFFFLGGKAEVYIQFLHCRLKTHRFFKPWIKLKLPMFSGSIIHHWSRWRYILQHKL